MPGNFCPMTAQLFMSSETSTAKAALLQAISDAPKPGGLPDPNEQIEACIAQLEPHTPVAAPTSQADLLSGNWRTLYTTNKELRNLGRAIPGFKSGEFTSVFGPVSSCYVTLARSTDCPI